MLMSSSSRKDGDKNSSKMFTSNENQTPLPSTSNFKLLLIHYKMRNMIKKEVEN